MIAHRFEYSRPGSAAEVAAQLQHTDGREFAIIGGGTWVIPEMSHHLRKPELVIDLRSAGLSGIVADADGIMVGAATTYTQIEQSPAAPAFLKKVAAGITGGTQVRNRGTIGGSACYANPVSDIPGALVALEATMYLRSHRATRTVAAADFFLDVLETCLEPDEILESIGIRTPQSNEVFSYAKFKTAEGSWPIVTAACVTTKTDTALRVAVGGAGTTPFVVELDGDESEEEIGQRARDSLRRPFADVFANADTRRHLVGVMTQRAVREITSLRQGESV